MTLGAKRIRIPLNVASYDEPREQTTGKAPKVWRGNDTVLEFGVFYQDALEDLGDVASLRFELMASRSGALHVQKVIAASEINTGLTLDQWRSYGAAHFAISLSGSDTNFGPSGTAKSITLWFAVAAITTAGKEQTLGAGSFVIEEDGTGSEDDPPEVLAQTYLREEADARFAPIHGDGAGTRFKTGYWQWWFPEEGKWRTLIPQIRDGAPSHTWGPPED